MTFNNSSEVARSFGELDFHDDTFVSMRVLPPQSRGDNAESVVEIQLLQYSEQTSRVLRFLGCANLRVVIDFDVLADNLPNNTSGLDAHADTTAMWSLMQSQAHDWGVTYRDMPTPLDKKGHVMKELSCFRVQLCGGVVEIIAKQFQVDQI